MFDTIVILSIALCAFMFMYILYLHYRLFEDTKRLNDLEESLEAYMEVADGLQSIISAEGNRYEKAQAYWLRQRAFNGKEEKGA